MCVGNRDGGDDAFGVRLGEELAGRGMPRVIIAGAEPERLLFRGAGDGYDHLIFVDAVDVGARAGSVVFLDAAEITSRFPQISTHRLSLGLLAQWVQAGEDQGLASGRAAALDPTPPGAFSQRAGHARGTA